MAISPCAKAKPGLPQTVWTTVLHNFQDRVESDVRCNILPIGWQVLNWNCNSPQFPRPLRSLAMLPLESIQTFATDQDDSRADVSVQSPRDWFIISREFRIDKEGESADEWVPSVTLIHHTPLWAHCVADKLQRNSEKVHWPYPPHHNLPAATLAKDRVRDSHLKDSDLPSLLRMNIPGIWLQSVLEWSWFEISLDQIKILHTLRVDGGLEWRASFLRKRRCVVKQWLVCRWRCLQFWLSVSHHPGPWPIELDDHSEWWLFKPIIVLNALGNSVFCHVVCIVQRESRE